MNKRTNNLMRIWVNAGISAAKFNKAHAVSLLTDLGVPESVIQRTLP